jgi:hypothetical protein
MVSSDKVLLPGYRPTRVMLDGAFLAHLDAGNESLLALSWAAALAIAVYVVLRRKVGTHGRATCLAALSSGRFARDPARCCHGSLEPASACRRRSIS